MHGKSVIGLGRTFAVLMCTILGVVLFSDKTFAYSYQPHDVHESSLGAEEFFDDGGSNHCNYAKGVTWQATSTYQFTDLWLHGYTQNGASATSTLQIKFYTANSSTKLPTGSPLTTFTTTTLGFWNNLTNPGTNGTNFIHLPSSLTIASSSWYSMVIEHYDMPHCDNGTQKGELNLTGHYTASYSSTEKGIWTTDRGSSYAQHAYTPTAGIQAFDFRTYTRTGASPSDHNLSITQPKQDDRLPNYTEPSFIGTCDSTYTPLTLQVTPVYCFWGGGAECEASHSQDPLDYIISPINCIGNAWTYSGLLLAGYTGRVSAKILDSTTASSTSVGFFLVDSSGWPGSPGNSDWYHNGNDVALTCNPLVAWTCDLPLVGDFCAAGATVVNESACYISNTIRNYEGVVTSTYPFAYGFQIMNALYSEADYATTSSSTIPTFVLNLGHGSTTIFNLNGTPPTAFEDITTTLYPWLVLLIHIGFIIYLVSLIL